MRNGKRSNLVFSLIACLLMTGFVFSCAGGANSHIGPDGNPLAIEPTNLPRLNARKIPAGNYVFNDAAQWEKFWEEYHAGEAPEIDFDKCTLVGVFLGRKPNPGYSVTIAEAKEYSDKVVIKTIFGAPDPEKVYAQVITYPYDTALIQKAGKQVRFESTR